MQRKGKRTEAPFSFVPEPPKSESYSKYAPVIRAAFENPEQWIMIDTHFQSRGGAEAVRRLNREQTDAQGRRLEFKITQVLNDPGQEKPYHQLFLRAVGGVLPGRSPRAAGEGLHFDSSRDVSPPTAEELKGAYESILLPQTQPDDAEDER